MNPDATSSSLDTAAPSVRRRIRDGWDAIVRAQAGRFFLWTPVAFGAGCAFYLTLRFEPTWTVIAAAGVALLALLILIGRLSFPPYLSKIVILILLFACGAGVTKARTERVRAPVLAEGGAYRVEAIIVDVISTSREQPKLLLAPLRIEGVTAAQTPIRLRISLRPEALEGGVLKPGQAIRALMVLHPPSGPPYPGGYDFARQAYFSGVGAQGFAPGRLTVIDAAPVKARMAVMLGINGFRWGMTRSIVDAISRPSGPLPAQDEAIGGFAAAMISGHQAFVSDDLSDSLRDSGLAHILSISGLHMALVGGFSFFLFRWLMAWVPFVALRWPIKKIAAGAAMTVVAVYLVISGAPAPAVRAAIVAWIAFAAILFDRQALSLRALAVAALVVLTLTPEAVIQPGFQMSFCATAALLALAEAHRPAVREIEVPKWVRLWQKTVAGVGLSLLASLVAGAATAPFTLSVFNRLTPYGLISNLFEAPISAFWVMPSLFLGTVLKDTLIGVWILKGAGVGLMAIRFVSDQTAALPGAVVRMASAPAYVGAMAFAGVLIVCLVRGRARWVGLALGLCLVIWPRVTPSDVWIDAEGSNAAIRRGDEAYALRPKVRLYGYRQWIDHYGLKSLNTVPEDDTVPSGKEEAAEDALTQAYVCKAYVCVPTREAPYRIGFAFGRKPPKPEALETLCRSSDLVVIRATGMEWPAACASTNRITGEDFRRLGALELTRTTDVHGQGQWLIRAAAPLRGTRPWTQKASGQ